MTKKNQHPQPEPPLTPEEEERMDRRALEQYQMKQLGLSDDFQDLVEQIWLKEDQNRSRLKSGWSISDPKRIQ